MEHDEIADSNAKLNVTQETRPVTTTELAQHKENVAIEMDAVTKTQAPLNSEQSPKLERLQLPTTKSYQARALARKTLAYERRTCCTTCCCVFMCPFIMVLLCGILGIVVVQLLQHIVTAEDVQYCSNYTALDPYTNIPLSNANSPNISGRIMYNIDESTDNLASCVRWFSHEYPVEIPYQPAAISSCWIAYNPAVCPLQDTTYLAAPALGWLGDFEVNATSAFATIGYAIESQNNFWALYQEANGLSVGQRPRANSVPLLGGLDPPATNYSGFLALLPTEYYILPDTLDVSLGAAALSNVKLEQRPYFQNVPGDLQAMDDLWGDTIRSILTQLDGVTKPANNLLANDSLVVNYTKVIAGILSQVPFGAVVINNLGPTKFDYMLQVGTNSRLAYTSVSNSESTSGIPNSPFPGEGLRRILFQSKISQAIMNIIAPGYTISQGLRIFPTNANTGISFPIGSYIGQILYPFGVSFLFPLFLLALVKDKEERILVMMKMNGLKVWVYWLSEYTHFYILHIINTAVFIITGLIFKLQFFTLTQPGVYILLFFLWGHVQILMAFLLSSFFQRSRYALLVAFILVVAAVIINIATTSLYTTTPAPVAYYIWPPFAMYRAIGLINAASYTAGVPSYTIDMVKPGDEVYATIVALIIAIFVLIVLSIYLFEVLPSEFGVRKPWHYPLTVPYEYIKGLIYKDLKQNQVYFEPVEQQNKPGEDEDVIAERLRVENNQYPATSSLVIRNMKKYYGQKFAVKGVSLAVEPGLVFGLLGPNGAGKTSLISILTGLYEASEGEAYLAGYKVGEEMDKVYRSMGVCPQHDILWPELSVEEHLYFYARLKGVPPSGEAAAVDAALAKVSLTKFRTRPSKGLSGGEKRRLSIAIALIGNGQVIFLDEPTTGLDPEVRRLIWNIINEQRVGKTIILTTHSMEEAEVLCQKIGIMAKGTLRVLGPQLHLKNKYGSGFKLTVACDPLDAPRARLYVEELLPVGFKRIDSFAGNFSYEFPFKENAVGHLFEQLSNHAAEHGIVDWGVSQTSLEEVFLSIVAERDAMADSS